MAGQVGATPKQLDCGEMDSDDVTLRYHVTRIYDDAFAIGGVITCSGAPLIWQKKGATWEVIGGNSRPSEEFWAKHNVPKAFYE